MNPHGLVAPTDLTNKNKRTSVSLVRFWDYFIKVLVLIFGVLSLTACQHLGWVNSPLPVTLTPSTTPAPIQTPQPNSTNNTNPTQTDTTNTPFFILENWF